MKIIFTYKTRLISFYHQALVYLSLMIGEKLYSKLTYLISYITWNFKQHGRYVIESLDSIERGFVHLDYVSI